MRLRRLAGCKRAVLGTAETSTIGATKRRAIALGFNQMKKATLHVEQQSQPRNIQRADIAPINGYAMVVDGHFKIPFAEKGPAMKGATELLAKYPMLQVELYDASSKSRALVK